MRMLDLIDENHDVRRLFLGGAKSQFYYVLINQRMLGSKQSASVLLSDNLTGFL